MKTRKNRRFVAGGAMVEMAVLMVAVVPMILIPLYLQDALLFKLTAQERVFSSAWDFAMGNYEEREVSAHWSSIDNQNKEIFKNCKSGNDKDKTDPATPWADFRWPSSGIKCEQKEKDFMKPGMVPLASSFHGEYTKGGLVECEGAIEVANHYVPERIGMLTLKKDKEFFQEQGRFFEHNDGGEPMKFGLLVDPWTIHKPDDIENSGGNDAFKERVEFCWGSRGSSITAGTLALFDFAFLAFMAKAMQKELLSPALMAFDYPPRPADITSVHPISEEYDRNAAFGRRSFWVSPYKDGAQDTFKKTYEERKQTYLGCPNALDDGNC